MQKRSPVPYAIASFASAFLLFLVQPMIAKSVTPTYGGTASVWNSALLIGQLLLLAGSFYAYRMIDGRGTSMPRKVNLVVTIIAAITLLALPAYAIIRPLPAPLVGIVPEIGVPLLMMATVGPGMLLLGAQSPLLQRSYSMSSGHANPYPLYAASNAGSLVGLLAYPLIFEPLTGTENQLGIWEAAVIAVLVANAILIYRGEPMKDGIATGRTGPSMKLKWMIPAFLATAIMMSSGQALSSDIMAMPLIWVLPLGAFLVGYMTAFSSAETSDFKRNLKIPQTGLLILAAATANPLIIVNPIIGLIAIVSIGLVTHGLIRSAYESRPQAETLGSFYLSLALGGALAGILVGVISPLVFDWRWELPLCLVGAALILVPNRATELEDRRSMRTIGMLMALAAIAAGGLSILFQLYGIHTTQQIAGTLLVCLAIAIQSTTRTRGFALWTLWLMLSTGLVAQLSGSWKGELRRSYYGVMSVENTIFDGRPATLLTHGTTVHGLQMRDRPDQPTSYYTPEGGLGDAMRAIGKLNNPRIEVAGLGAGTIACLTPPGSDLVFHEIDPEVAAAARKDFSFISTCAPDARTVIGDARVLIENGSTPVDAMILDAFTSDAIPMHLMTEEALDGYVDRLSNEGWLILHVSNRYLDVSAPVAAWAEKRGYEPMVLDNDIEREGRVSRSVWMAIRPDGWKEEENGWKADPRWQRAHGEQSWTDDRSSIIDIIRSL